MKPALNKIFYYTGEIVNLSVSEDILSKLSATTAHQHQVLPIKYDEEDNILTILVGKTEALQNIEIFAREAGARIRIEIVEPVSINSLRTAITQKYDSYSIQDINEDYIEDEMDSPIVKKVNEILNTAEDRDASDIHLIPTSESGIVYFRIDGKLYDVTNEYRIVKSDYARIVQRIKLMCIPPMAIEQRSTPQDGALKISKTGKDCRVNTVPTIWGGEKIAIRLLESGAKLKKLDELGFDLKDLAEIRKILKRPNGLFLVAGPTGSGKSTTLYAILQEYGNSDYNIITIENPVEIKVPGITQVQVDNHQISFADVLRAGLRQDPDILLIGEIRDKVTAEVAVQASQTGHLVFSTVHSQTSVSSVSRLFDLGINHGSLLWELTLILSQRLVSLNCPYCLVKDDISNELLSLLTKEERAMILQGSAQKSTGCNKCGHTKVSGRIAIAELLVFNNEIRDLFATSKSLSEIMKKLQESGYKSMWDKGLERVSKGLISFEELILVISPSR